jgi:hypothetical protein
MTNGKKIEPLKKVEASTLFPRLNRTDNQKKRVGKHCNIYTFGNHGDVTLPYVCLLYSSNHPYGRDSRDNRSVLRCLLTVLLCRVAGLLWITVTEKEIDLTLQPLCCVFPFVYGVFNSAIGTSHYCFDSCTSSKQSVIMSYNEHLKSTPKRTTG